MKKIFILFSLVVFANSIFAQVELSELTQTNMSILADEDGDYSDWLEIRNNGATAVNLNGYGITNDPLSPFKWVMPAYIS